MYQLSLAVATIWLLALFLPPAMMAAGHLGLGLIGYQVFSVICHQIPDRSWHSQGFPLAVCSRCTAIYFGALLGLLIYPSIARSANRHPYFVACTRRWVTISFFPMLVDVGLDWLKIWRNTFTSRSLTGLTVGIAGALHLYSLLVDAASDWHRTDRQQSSLAAMLEQTGERNDDQ